MNEPSYLTTMFPLIICEDLLLVSWNYSVDIFDFLSVCVKTLKEILQSFYGFISSECFLFLDFGDIPPLAAQDIVNVLKQGHLEKKRKGI